MGLVTSYISYITGIYMSENNAEPATPDWEERGRPATLFRRFEFDDYNGTRNFLDALEVLSKEHGYYPDLSFGTTYVNVTVKPRDEEEITEEDRNFALQVNGLVESGASS